MSATFPRTPLPPPGPGVDRSSPVSPVWGEQQSPSGQPRTKGRPLSGPIGRWACAGGAAVAAAGLTSYIYLIDPNNPTNAYPKCPLKLLTGLDCPGCGGLRATYLMLHGDILGALSHNVLALVIVPVMAYLLLRWVLGRFDRQWPKVPTPYFTRWALPLGVLAFTIVRNIPNTPFYYFNSATG